jgi:FixJ family two-component response regulator
VVHLFLKSTLAAHFWSASTSSVSHWTKAFQGVDEARKGNSMTEKRLLVTIVDDDESVRESLPDLLQEMGFAARAFSSAEEFLKSDAVSQAACLLLDIAMPGMSGPELQRELKRRRIHTPVIFITAHQNELVRRDAIEQGAAAWLLKPFTDTALMNALDVALPGK